MKKIINYVLLMFCTFIIFTITASASTWTKDSIPNKSYVIGKSLYTEQTVLTTRHVMLAAKTIDSDNLNDMKIYYKTIRGAWIDPITKEATTPPTSFQIEYIDLVSTIATYTITFNTNGGSQVATQSVLEYETLTEPEDPTKEGYMFVEWQLNGETFDFDKTMNELELEETEIELTAIWEPMTYTIEFDGNGADNETTEMDSVECTYGDDNCQLTANIYTREHYTFNGWATTDDASEAEYNDEDTANDIVPTTNNSIVTLYAVWIPDEYNIVYEGLDETVVSSNGVKYSYGVDATIYDPKKDGYTFAGWTSEELEITTPTKSLVIPSGTTGDITLTANWTANTYTITFNSNGGSGTMNEQTCTYGQSCTLPTNAYTKMGYTTDGWAESAEGNKVHNVNATSTGFATEGEYELFVHWIPVEYTITYNGIDGATFEEENPTTHTIEDDAITLNPPQKDNYTFIGWTGSNGEEPQTEVTIQAHATGNLTYTANWEAETYTITFNQNGSNVTNEMDELECTAGIPCTLPTNTFARNGYTFSGWSTTTNSTEVAYADGAEAPSTTITLYAIWTLIEYPINYNLNGGSASNLTVSYNIETDSFGLATPTKTGYTFIGWTGSNGTNPQTEVIITKGTYGEKTYTASWALNNYQVTYNANGGTGEAMDNTNCTYNTNCTLAENTYTRENYIFSGWSLTSDGEIISNGTVNIPTDNSPITVYAIWTPVWEFDSTTGTITKYNGTEENVVIPETINNVNVTAIAEGAFESEAMRTLEFSQHIASVAPNAIKMYENTSLRLFMNTNQIRLYEADSIEGWPSVFGITQETISNHRSSAIGDEPNVIVAYIEFNNINIYNIDFRYTITYEGIDEDTEVSNPTIFFEFSQDFTLTNPRKDGYTFAGWTSDNITITNPFEVTIPSGTSKNLTFTATWEEDNNS